MDEYTFRIWDTRNINVIDAFEIFSGLIVFSSTSFRDKVKLLFEIFDLNDHKAMNETEIEFMMYCILVAVFKINRITGEVNQEEVVSFISINFGRDCQVSFEQLYKWACKNRDVAALFRVLNIEFEEKVSEKFDLELVDVKDPAKSNLSKLINSLSINPDDIMKLHNDDFLSDQVVRGENSREGQPVPEEEEEMGEYLN